MHHFYQPFGGMHFWWWLIGSIIIVSVFIILIFAYVRPTKREEPLDILKRRFAAGEISKEEFEAAKKALENEV